MYRFLVFIISIISLSNLKANMAYWGPPKGDMSGIFTSKNIRITRENLTVDLRQVKEKKFIVFADYDIMAANSEGLIQFVFVAQQSQGNAPEFILDGEPVPASGGRIAQRFLKNSQVNDTSEIARFIDKISAENRLGHSIPLEENIFIYEINLAPGKHKLKVGYECKPAYYDEGDLGYTLFPYFLGNADTKKYYDSIYLKCFLPDSYAFQCNYPLKKSGNFYVSNNIAAASTGQLYISLFRDVRPELGKGRILANTFAWLYAIILLFLMMLYTRMTVKRRQPIWQVLALFIPVGILSAYVMFKIWDVFYSHFRNLYDPFLSHHFGRGYWGVGLVLVGFVVSVLLWISLTLLYAAIVRKGKYDPLNYLFKPKK